MGVVDFLARLEVASFNFHSHLTVGIAEGHALGSQTVHFLNAEHKVVTWVVENVFVHLQSTYNVGCHTQTVTQFLEGRQEHLLRNLQVVEIA